MKWCFHMHVWQDNTISPPPCVSSCWDPFSLLSAACTSSFLAGILFHSYIGNEERGVYSLLGLLWSDPEVPEVRSPETQSKFLQGLPVQTSTSHSPFQDVVFPLCWVFHVNITLKEVMRERQHEYLLYAKNLTCKISLNTHLWSHFPHKETGSVREGNSP